MGGLIAPRVGRQQLGCGEWSVETPGWDSTSPNLWQFHRHTRTLRRLSRVPDASHQRGCIHLNTCLGTDASLHVAIRIVSKTNHCLDHTTAFPLSLSNRPPWGDKQPGLKCCFCKLNSVGLEDYHYVNCMPKFSIYLPPATPDPRRMFVRVSEYTIVAQLASSSWRGSR